MMLIYSDHALRRARQRRAPVFRELPDGREPAAVVGDDPADESPWDDGADTD